jgi:hypothetical protein
MTFGSIPFSAAARYSQVAHVYGQVQLLRCQRSDYEMEHSHEKNRLAIFKSLLSSLRDFDHMQHFTESVQTLFLINNIAH